MNFEAVIGLEIHVQLKTKSKMFSSSPNTFGEEPNTNISSYDLAFPGTMPTVNKEAVISAIRVCHALKMDIDDELWFDRKNYFYSDLPKGYQITQHYRPIGKNGYLKINTDSGEKIIHLSHLQIEEDAGKQIHEKDKTLVDFNRAGIPLLEIVSKPEFTNGEEAMKYVEKIRSIVTFLDASDGKMENGSLRCDVNVSLRPYGYKHNGTKIEIKNVNTLVNIKRAIDFEIKRQQMILLSGKKVVPETRRYDEFKKETAPMRIKSIDSDYKYFTDPNIAPIKLSKEFIEDAIKTSKELADHKFDRYLKLGLTEYDATLILNSKDVSLYFDEMIQCGANPKLSANWINTQVQEVLNKQRIEITSFKIKASDLANLIIKIQNGEISNKQARGIFDTMLRDGKTLSSYDSINGGALINDAVLLKEQIKQILDANPNLVVDYQNGKDKVVGYIVGQVMKTTNGKANPSLTSKLVLEELKER